MGKHDKVIEASTIEYLQNRIDDLTRRNELAQETIGNLQVQCSRMSKWASEVEADAQDRLKELEDENAMLRGKIARLVEVYV